MILDQNILQLDIKIQDKYRELLAQLGKDGVQLQCVQLGDSDIDYEMSIDMNKTRVLNAPYNVKGIKYPLIYNGSGKGVKGQITCFTRLVSDTGAIYSLYEYPTNSNFTFARIPPSLENGLNWSQLQFSDLKMGYILFFQTLLDGYVDTITGKQKRLKEKMSFDITFNGSTVIPDGWQIIKDEENDSLFISKDSISVLSNVTYLGEITITGEISQNSTTIKFNY